MLTTWTRRLTGSIGAFGILRLGLAIADGDEVGAVETKLLGQVLLDRIGATLGEVLVIGLAADRIGMTGNHEGRTLQAGVRKRLAEFLHRRHRALADVGRVVVEADFEIDLRLGRGEFGDFLRARRARATASCGCAACRRSWLPWLERRCRPAVRPKGRGWPISASARPGSCPPTRCRRPAPGPPSSTARRRLSQWKVHVSGSLSSSSRVTPAILAGWRFDAARLGQVQNHECDLDHVGNSWIMSWSKYGKIPRQFRPQIPS